MPNDPQNVLYTLWPFASGQKEPDAASWPEEIRSRINEHVSNEHSIMIEYERLAEDSAAEDIRFLMRVVLDDEQRHHRWFRELRNSLDAAIELRTMGTTIPAVGSEKVTPELLAATERLLEVEHDDARELRALRKAMKPVEETTLWSLLVEVMEHDTRKHIAILEHIRRLVRDRLQD